MSKPCIALVGYGGWGKNIARTLNDLHVLKSVVDMHYTPRTPVEGLNATFDEFDHILQDQDIKGVAIATPTPSHFDLAHEALTAGKHVFLEKPFVETDAQLKRLKKAQGKQVLMVGHLMIYHNAFLKMKEVCAKGEIGDILKIETSRKNFGKVHAHEGVLWDIGPHDFSMILHLMGEAPKRIFSKPVDHIHKGCADTETILMDFEGAVAETQLSRIHPEKEQKVIVMGEKGTLVLDDTQPWAHKLTHYAHNIDTATGIETRATPTYVPLEEKSPLTAEMEHFLTCMETGAQPRTPLSEAETVLKMLQGAEASFKKSTYIDLTKN